MITVLFYAGFAVLLTAPVVLALAACRPDEFRISRRIVIHAAPETVFAFIDRFPAWEEWSPWDKIDPALRRTYSGPASGVGASYAWQGSKKVGTGDMTILEAMPHSRIDIELTFEKPMRARNLACFTLTPQDGGTMLEWTMSGASPYMAKLFGLLVDMDELVGRDFEKGLAALKAAAEARRG